MTNRTDRALAFRALHIAGTQLVLPNAWDAVSALLVEDALHGAGAGGPAPPAPTGSSSPGPSTRGSSRNW
ncbi:hypothetical protein ABZ192_02715 [Streptomyces sp. NPDC006235]|uniref:hypothetical protein n=1 Tax=Streptomyces sp. NPDC006235 TaxID=3156736 RepID=UPI0033B62A80